MDSNKELLVNYIRQKFVKIARIARIKEEDGKANDTEFKCLKKLHALMVFLLDNPSPTYDQFKKTEMLAQRICGREIFPYRAMDWTFIAFEPVEPGTEPETPLNACDILYSYNGVNFGILTGLPQENTVCKNLDYIIDQITYDHPWMKFAHLSGYEPGKYEVGSPNILTQVAVTANKLALESYFIDFEGTLVQYARELKDNLPNQSVQLNFNIAEEKVFELKGNYRDLQKYKGENLLAETGMKWESKWPCYYGTGPLDAMDDVNTRNAFVQSLTRTLDCPECFYIDIPEGHVAWYFYPYSGKARQFKTIQGIMTGSFKGTFDFRTKSMDDHNVAGSGEYGVVRTMNPGIRCLDICVVELRVCELEIFPVDDVTPPADSILYSSLWSDVVCNKVVA